MFALTSWRQSAYLRDLVSDVIADSFENSHTRELSSLASKQFVLRVHHLLRPEQLQPVQIQLLEHIFARVLVSLCSRELEKAATSWWLISKPTGETMKMCWFAPLEHSD